MDAKPASLEDDEATAAAMAHLKALEEAERFEPGPSDPQDLADLKSSRVSSLLGNDTRPRIEYTPATQVQRTYSVPVHTGMPQRAMVQPSAPVAPAVQSIPAAPLPVPKDLRVIEDIYAMYPIGDGETFMRVERTAPKTWRGVPVVGALGDIYERVSMDEFTARFGGNVYSIHVIGRAPTKGAPDESPLRTLTTVELKVPGPPAIDGISLEDTMQPLRPGTRGLGQMFPPPAVYQNGAPTVPESVLLAQLQAEERAREREEAQRNELMSHARPPREVIEAATKAARDAVDIARAGADEKVAILRDQNQGLLDSLSRRDEELRILRDKLTASERAAAEARQYTETEQIKRLTEMHASALAKLQDDHSREMNRVLQESRDKLSDETRRHIEERAKAEGDSMRERQRLQEDYDRRERAVKEQNDLIRLQMKEQYDARITDLERRTTEQISAVKEQRDREIESLRTSVRAEATVVEKTSGFRVDHLQARVLELSSEADRLRRENDDLRKKGQKDPVAYLQECATVARDLLGMVKPEEVEREAPAAAGDGEAGWKGIAAKGLMGLVDGLPKIVEQVSAVRAANQQAAAQRQAMQAAQQQPPPQMMRAPGPQVRNALPPAQAQQMMMQQAVQADDRRRALIAPPPTWAGSPAPPGAAPMGAPSPYAGPIMSSPVGPVTRPVHSIVTGVAGDPAGLPVTGQMVFTGGSPVQPEVPQPVPSAPLQNAAPPPQESRPAQQSSGGVEITQEQIMEFISQLNEHISEGTPVELFAYGFVNKVGKPVAADLITKISANDLLSSIAEADGGEASYILTSNGRDYVQKLWSETKKIVAMPDE